jgi:8-oxo-dGTP pyrophosphatase MutT (NUDIX family)
MKLNKQAGVWAIIYCPSAGSFLFGKRSETVNKPGVWNFFGGHVDPGETPRQALLRELSEEAGIERSGEDLVHFGGISDDEIQGLGYVEALRELHYYLLLADSEFAPRLNDEHSEFRWLKPNNLPHNLNRPSAIAINIGLIQKALQLAN